MVLDIEELRQKERSIFTEVESKGLLAYYELVANQIVNLDQKAESVVNLEGLLLALMAVFTTIAPSAKSGLSHGSQCS